MSRWQYGYNDQDELTDARRSFEDWGVPVAGQQFSYGYDNIGNRNFAHSGGDTNGANLRQIDFTATALNQSTSLTKEAQGFSRRFGSKCTPWDPEYLAGPPGNSWRRNWADVRTVFANARCMELPEFRRHDAGLQSRPAVSRRPTGCSSSTRRLALGGRRTERPRKRRPLAGLYTT